MDRNPFNKILKRHQKYIAAIALAAIGILWLLWVLFVPASPIIGVPQAVTIQQGESVFSIAQTLKDRRLIYSSNIFAAYVTLRGWEHKLKAGDYIIPANSSLVKIAHELVYGQAKSDDIVVVIPEGSNIWEIDQSLANKALIVPGQFASQFLNKEGYLFPDTYRFPNPDKEKSTISALGDKMLANFDNRTRELLGSLSDDEKRRIVTIASMLEKEAKTGEDMRLVSGIIERRIDIGMLLQIDATVAYGACVRNFQTTRRNCDVTLVGIANELKRDGAYNSYIRKGLPPGPIANPGLKAIQAALHAQRSDYLFYLSTRDGSQLIFSKTAQEHAANRRKYLGI